MQIALVSPLYESVPPRLYGGTERVVQYLGEALQDLGHAVTIYASGDSLTRADLRACGEKSLRLDRECCDVIAPHVLQLERVLQEASNFDVIHFHSDWIHYPLLRRVALPAISTLHGRLDRPVFVRLLNEFRELSWISISESQRQPIPDLNWMASIHHGLPEHLLNFEPNPGDYLAFLGRMTPDKGPQHAIEIARRTGVKLRIAAKVDPADRPFFENLEPRLRGPHVEFIGEISEREKQEFLGKARALLFPIQWPEPFGLVLLEAMAVGTPVIAFPCGAVPEIIRDGVSGFLVRDVDDAVAAVGRLDELSRRRCRQEFESRFTSRRMALDHLRVYDRVIRNRVRPRPRAKGVESAWV